MLISPDDTRRYLERDQDMNLMLLGALAYDPVEACFGVSHGGRLAAVALVVDLAANLPDSRPTIMVAADEPAALERLVSAGSWPAAAIWTAARPELVGALERLLGRAADPHGGVCTYVGWQTAPPGELVRRITEADADALDLRPCGLSPVALRGWLRCGWRMFGVVRGTALLSHALAAYPLGDTEEIAAVFTAPAARRQRLASAVAAAAGADIQGRGRRPVYVAARANRASRRVAERLGMALIHETREILV